MIARLRAVIALLRRDCAFTRCDEGTYLYLDDSLTGCDHCTRYPEGQKVDVTVHCLGWQNKSLKSLHMAGWKVEITRRQIYCKVKLPPFTQTTASVPAKSPKILNEKKGKKNHLAVLIPRTKFPRTHHISLFYFEFVF